MIIGRKRRNILKLSLATLPAPPLSTPTINFVLSRYPKHELEVYLTGLMYYAPRGLLSL